MWNCITVPYATSIDSVGQTCNGPASTTAAPYTCDGVDPKWVISNDFGGCNWTCSTFPPFIAEVPVTPAAVTPAPVTPAPVVPVNDIQIGASCTSHISTQIPAANEFAPNMEVNDWVYITPTGDCEW